MKRTLATTFGPMAIAGADARPRWSSHSVKQATNGIYHRPPGVST